MTNNRKIIIDYSWLDGIYKYGIIDVKHNTICIYNEFLPDDWDTDFYDDGEQAHIYIEEIYNIWIKENIDQEQAFLEWINNTI